MTNQEWLCSLSAKDFLCHIRWLLQNYGKRWTDSDPAIIEWLQGEHEVNTPGDKGMTREEAIELLVNATYSDEFQGNEDLTTAHNMAIKALKQEPILDKIRAEIADYDDLIGHNAQVQWCLKVIDKYKAESEDGVCKDCYYNDGEVHAECVICDKAESEGK